MNKQELFQQIQNKRSFLCVGLDSDITKIPKHLLGYDDPVFEFNKQIIDATLPYTIAYKPNVAFYESRGAEGWISLQRTIEYLNTAATEVFTIADAKRGDIGNTSKMYAKAFFEQMHFDAITVAPYMGVDSVGPFLEYKNKWTILLALTSNEGATDFQLARRDLGEALQRFGIHSVLHKLLYERVIIKAQEWGTDEQLMFVIGATKADYFTKVRVFAPNNFLLVPGVGAQGGSLQEVAELGMNSQCGLIVNSSRGIIFASSGVDFAEKAAEAARELQIEMEVLLRRRELIP
jgi:orotidine-5'-phosphate decarboxylase